MTTAERKAQDRVRSRAYYTEHRERILARRRATYAADKPAGIVRASKWSKANPTRVRAAKWRAQGIDAAAAEAMFAQHRGICDLCGTAVANGRWKQWHVDHCHRTGVVRGLLCHTCNTGLGLVDRVGLPAIEQYLRRSTNEPVAKSEASPSFNI